MRPQPPRLHLIPAPPSPSPAAGRQGGYARPLIAVALLALFHGLPWLSLGGAPALLMDLAQHRAHLLGTVLLADSLPALLAMLLAALAALYLLTHLGGRLWCGFACPQSVLGELYLRLQSQCGPRAGKLAWAALALWTGVSFVGYFVPIRSLMPGDLSGWSGWIVFWAGFYALATWANIRFLRMRVCSDLCPFARLQPWIGDRHTPHVAYLAARGEPRGPRPPGSPGIAQRGRALLDHATAQDYVFRAANPALAGAWPQFAANRLGDCSDCGQCRTQCPLELDIRNGHDARCLDCGACINACNAQLAAHGYRPGLLQRCSQARLQGERTRWLRVPTLVAVATLLVSLIAAGWLLG